MRVLAYPKFKLSAEDRHELIAAYLPCCEIVEAVNASPLVCRDTNDQKFLDLLKSGNAGLLITGDADLLVLAEEADFVIETPSSYQNRVG